MSAKNDKTIQNKGSAKPCTQRVNSYIRQMQTLPVRVEFSCLHIRFINPEKFDSIPQNIGPQKLLVNI